MKLLTIGIDGGTASVFDAFDMPFWRSLRARDVTFPVVEDLNQRGWARMLSGQGAEQNGCVYMRPTSDQSRTFDFAYNYKTMSAAPGFVPIWQLAEATGARVAMMNVPTTAPAQPVNGFYVAGGGGGIFQGGLPEGAVHPKDIATVLGDEGYIFDTRLGAENFGDIETVAAHIKAMMDARGRSFARLGREFEIDFGFVAFRATTVLLFLAMSEVAHIQRYPPDSPRRRSWSKPWLALIDEHMRALDDVLARLFDELQPEHHIIVSDHSIVPWTHNVDFDGFLAEAGFARRAGSTARLVRNATRAVLNRDFRGQLRNVPLGSLTGTLRSIGAPHDKEARAFAGWYVYGIYINDRDRFGGPVADSDVAAETEAIVQAFNWTATRHDLPMRAAPYRATFGDAPQAHVLPDVTILQSGQAFPSPTLGPWYAQNPNFAPVRRIKGVGGMHSGQKGVNPILMADPGLAALKGKHDPTDLRLVYHLTKNLYASA